MNLKYFTQSEILRQIGSPRLEKLFDRFRSGFKAENIVLPTLESENGSYFDSLAGVLASPASFPEPLQVTLLSLEAAASPENDQRLDSAIKRRIPCISLSSCCALDRALELWFHAPEELSQFQSTKGVSPIPVYADTPQPTPATETPKHGNNEPPPSGSPSTVAPSSLSAHPVSSFQHPESPPPVSPPCSDPDVKAFEQLARLSPAQYDRARRAEARRLHLRIQTLDSEVAKRRTELAIEAQANAVKLPAIEPWPDPVNGSELLDQVSDRFSLYLVVPCGAADASALWIGHAHAFAAFQLTPRLNFHSPKEGCGKTTAFDVLTTMVPRPLRTENISAPVLFRLVDQHQPTLLLDEVDAYLPQAEELRGLLNAGHKRGACAYRCEGDGNAVRAFNAFAPAALAGIGSLPATLRDRSILIPLVAAEEGQILARFDQFHTEIENVLARKLARWAKDNFAALAACDPPLPPGAFNRLADNWRPLLAIAHVAGGDWPARALAAFTKLTPSSILGALNSQLSTLNSQLLLADIRQIFAQSGAQRLFSSAVVNSLRALPDRPWTPGNDGQKPIDEAWLARQLRPFNIAPHNIRIAADRAKGYDLADFAESFARFINAGSVS